MSEFTEIKRALFAQLSASTALTDHLGGTKIYDTIAPPEASLPYVIFQFMGGGHENIIPIDSLDERWMVKALACTQAVAGSADDIISDILHKSTLDVDGWGNFSTTRRNKIWGIDDEGARPVFHAGAFYRIRLCKH